MIVPRVENRFLSSTSVPKQRPTISPRRNPPQPTKPQLKDQQQQLVDLDHRVLSDPEYGGDSRQDEFIVADDAVIPCTRIDETEPELENYDNDSERRRIGDFKPSTLLSNNKMSILKD